MTGEAGRPLVRQLSVVALCLGVVGALVAPFSGAEARGPVVAFSFRSVTKMPFGTTEGESAVVGGRVFLFGGFDATNQTSITPTDRAFRFDPGTEQWSFLAAMPERGVSHAGIATDGSRSIYYAGGYAMNASGTGQVYGTTHGFRYDVVTNSYSRLPDLPAARAAGGLAYVGGQLFYFGGANLARTYDATDVWSLDVAHGATAWVARAAMPNGRNHLGWGVIGGRIYVVGGQHGTSGADPQAELDVYDPGTNAWRVLAPMPEARSHEMDSTFVMNGKLVAAGGWTQQVSGAVTAYDPATNRWESWSDLPEKRTSTTVRAFSATQYLFCCGSAGGSTQSTWIATRRGAPPVVHAAPRITFIRAVPSTVRSSAAGRAVIRVRLTRSARTTVVLQRCTTTWRCSGSVLRRVVTLHSGSSSPTVRSLTGRATLPAARYVVGLTPRGGHGVGARLFVRP